MVHQHVRNMSLAAYLPAKRTSVLPPMPKDLPVEGPIAGQVDLRRAGPLEEKIKKEELDLIEQRSPLADLLYLRCESIDMSLWIALSRYRAGRTEVAVGSGLNLYQSDISICCYAP